MPKKYMSFILIAFLVGVCIFSNVDAQIREVPLLGRVIFVDPGHPSLDKPNVII